MLTNLKLKQKFTIILLVILIFGLSVCGLSLSTILRQNAEREITSTGILLMETMTSVREYTTEQIQPKLQDQLETEFLPQSVPAYSATEVFNNLREKANYGQFFYKEATLNPTNPRDKADDFETKIIEKFRSNTDLKEWEGFRNEPSVRMFYVARPLAVSDPSCLECHDTPERAPKTQIKNYGPVGGFGWKLNEIVGAQVISVPASTVMKKANQYSFIVVGIVSVVFVAIILLVNQLLNIQIVRPLKRITRIAEEVSTGHMDVNFEQLSNDEIGDLAKAFKRMKLSLEMAMRRLKRPPGNTGNSGRYGGHSGY